MQPMPPNSCLTITMATKQPTIAIQMGNPAGRFMASSRPVTAALKSEMVLVRLVIRRNRYSNRIDAPTQTTSSTRARVPNTRTDATTAGSSAMRTSPMTEVVETLLRICGPAETNSLRSVILSPLLLTFLSSACPSGYRRPDGAWQDRHRHSSRIPCTD